jgi:N6-L-threonylcarbamoyladenine synthase
MITLAIETSCDETAVCMLETDGTIGAAAGGGSKLGYTILGNLIHSQVELHRKYGGVFPAMAKREHSKNLLPLLETLIKESVVPIKAFPAAGDAAEKLHFLKEKEPELLAHFLASKLLTEKPTIDQIAVTKGPGLEPALWVGVNCALALGKLWGIPVVAVNHMEGHILGSFLQSTELQKKQNLRPVAFPALALLVSGGHTELVLVRGIGDYEVIGRTKDDAVGEAFDKVARMLDLPYPGGAEIGRLAEKARKNNSPKIISLPRPMIHSHDLDFSFSGLKTAVLYTLRGDKSGKISEKNSEKAKCNYSQLTISEKTREEIAREFEEAVTDVLIAKTKKALDRYVDDVTPIKSLILGGGVSANTHICGAFEALAKQYSVPLYLPPVGISGDNALMIALAGALSGALDRDEASVLKASGNLSL